MKKSSEEAQGDEITTIERCKGVLSLFIPVSMRFAVDFQIPSNNFALTMRAIKLVASLRTRLRHKMKSRDT